MLHYIAVNSIAVDTNFITSHHANWFYALYKGRSNFDHSVISLMIAKNYYRSSDNTFARSY